MSKGMLLGDRYELVEIIGRGGMAEVWRARDKRLGRDVAIKRLRVDLATDPTFQARFQREAQSSAGLNHPNIVSVYDTGEAEDPKTEVNVPYIVMELVQGHTLRDVLRDGRKILPERALEFVKGVLDALAYSHKSGIIHRDIKPANVMLTPGGQVKVMDFGIARAVADTSATMTQTAAVIGTAQYLSPEQARGETVDTRSDIYSTGCLLYELLVSRPPFVGDSPVSVAYQHVREVPVPPSQIDPEITPDMDKIALKALAKDPDARYQTAEEMSADIGRLLSGQEVTAVIPASPSVLPEPSWANAATEVAPAGLIAGDDSTTGSLAASTQTQSPVEYEPRRRRRGAGGWIIALSIILATALAFGAYQLLNPAPPPPVTMVDVPSVIGLNEEAARSVLVNQQLTVGKVTHINKDDAKKNQVVEQNPAKQTKVAKDTPVNLVIDDGVKLSKVPEKLVGASEAEAKKLLAAAGFKPEVEQDNPATEDVNAKAGNVTIANPSSGAEVPAGSTVRLTIATGMSIVPNLSGKTPDDAKSVAKQSGFEIKIVRKETAEYPAGRVFEQTPGDGVQQLRTSPITVTVAVAPKETPTPTPTPEPSPTPTPTDTPTSPPASTPASTPPPQTPTSTPTTTP